jgi:hypothetical protein
MFFFFALQIVEVESALMLYVQTRKTSLCTIRGLVLLLLIQAKVGWRMNYYGCTASSFA